MEPLPAPPMTGSALTFSNEPLPQTEMAAPVAGVNVDVDISAAAVVDLPAADDAQRSGPPDSRRKGWRRFDQWRPAPGDGGRSGGASSAAAKVPIVAADRAASIDEQPTAATAADGNVAGIVPGRTGIVDEQLARRARIGAEHGIAALQRGAIVDFDRARVAGPLSDEYAGRGDIDSAGFVDVGHALRDGKSAAAGQRRAVVNA